MRAPAVPVATVAAAAAALVLPWPATWVERAFASGIYGPWQRAATSFSNAVPFALFDLVIAAAVTALLVGIARAWRANGPGRLRRAGAALLAALTVVSVVAIWFLAAWGLNYRRVPIAVRLDIDRRQATPARVEAFAEQTVLELNRLRPAAFASPWPDRDRLVATLAPAFAAALPAVGSRPDVVPGVPKWSLLQPYLRWAGIDGVTNPFVPEIVVNHDLLPIEWPFTVAHEWGHLAGLAHESEASYAGWLACLAGTDQTRYSARLWAFGHVVAAVPRDVQQRLLDRLDDGPRRDLRAISERVLRSVPVVRRVSWATYDRYLKTNRVSEGLASYDAALALIVASAPDLRHIPR